LQKGLDAGSTNDSDLPAGQTGKSKDPPHVGPIDGTEYADKRGRPNAKLAELEPKRRHGSAVSDDYSRAKRGKTVSSKARSI
jgi:hypothetical protein